MSYVNQPPSRPRRCRIAFIGDHPGESDILPGGYLLTNALSGVGLARDEVFLGNVCATRPPGGDLSRYDWAGEEIQRGIAVLLDDLAAYNPHLIVTLGSAPLHLFRNGNIAPKRSKVGYVWPTSVTKWRGSLFLSHETLFGGSSNDALVSPAFPHPPSVSSHHPTYGDPHANSPQTESEHNRPVPLSTGFAGDGALSPGGGVDLPTTAANRWKCLATLHPSFVLRAWSHWFDLRQDIKRAREEGETGGLVLPAYEVEWGPS